MFLNTPPNYQALSYCLTVLLTRNLCISQILLAVDCIRECFFIKWVTSKEHSVKERIFFFKKKGKKERKRIIHCLLSQKSYASAFLTQKSAFKKKKCLSSDSPKKVPTL